MRIVQTLPLGEPLFLQGLATGLLIVLGGWLLLGVIDGIGRIIDRHQIRRIDADQKSQAAYRLGRRDAQGQQRLQDSDLMLSHRRSL